MAYIPGCSADVFISYAHRDNQDGWVTRLKEKLAEKLKSFLGQRAEVWSDDNIQPGDDFREKIQQVLKNTPIFVAVVSPSYLESEFSIIDELDWFQNQGGRRSFNSSRCRRTSTRRFRRRRCITPNSIKMTADPR